MVAKDCVYTMGYGDWVHREAALRSVSPSDLERSLVVRPVDIECTGRVASEKARAAFRAAAIDALVVTDYHEQEVQSVTFWGAPIVSVYRIAGTMIYRQPER